MKILSIGRVLTIVAASWLAVHPAPALAGDENWRQRASTEETVTTSDIAAEIEFGREVAARILGRYRVYTKPALEKYVNLVGLTLANTTNRPELEFHFAILNTSEINAYAAPGGYIFITKGALELMKDESELAGVLAHEIAHVTEKHVVQELNIKGSDDSAASSVARIVGGSSDSARVAFAQAVDKAVGMLFLDGYKREDEAQADKAAVAVSALAGYDPGGLVRYLDRISAIKGKTVEVLDRTHPPFSARIVTIKDMMNAEGLESGEGNKNKERFVASMKDLK